MQCFILALIFVTLGGIFGAIIDFSSAENMAMSKEIEIRLLSTATNATAGSMDVESVPVPREAPTSVLATGGQSPTDSQMTESSVEARGLPGPPPSPATAAAAAATPESLDGPVPFFMHRDLAGRCSWRLFLFSCVFFSWLRSFLVIATACLL